MQALCYLICGFIKVSMAIPILLICASFFSSAAQPASASITSDLTNKSTRQGAFSLLYLGGNIGFSIGPLIAGFLYKNYLPLLFIGDAITTIIAIIVIYLNVPETKVQYELVDEEFLYDLERAEEGSIFTVLLKRPRIIVFALISMLLTFSYSQVGFSLPLFSKDIFGIERGAQVFGMLMSTNGIVVVLMTIFIIGRTKKYDASFNVALSGFFWTIGFIMLYIVSTIPMMIISTMLWTIGEILYVTNVGVYIANNTPKSHRGRFNSLYGIISGTGQALGPYLMGKYLLNNPIKNVWVISSLLSFSCAIIMYVFYIFENYKLRLREIK
jgi:MFS family permease